MNRFLILFVIMVAGLCGTLSAQNVPAVMNLFNGVDLTGWEVVNFGAEGPVTVDDSSIVLNMGDPMTGITWTNEAVLPRANYEVELDAIRLEGNDFFCGLTFPVKKDPCTLIVGGWGGGLVGLSSIDGADASENFTSRYKKFDDDRWYHVRLRVTDDSIRAWIDTEQVVDFAIGSHEIGIRVEVSRNVPLGLATYRTTAAYKNLRLRKLE